MHAGAATVLIVPGLRDHVPQHWQTLLATRLPQVRSITPLGRANLDCAARVEQIECHAARVDGPVILVAHSGGVVPAVRWARATTRQVRGALFATPPDFTKPLGEGYPSIDALRANGWLLQPRGRLRFPSIVAASRNDPLASYESVDEMAREWRSKLVDLGEVGHLNPASGYGEWPAAEQLIAELDAVPGRCRIRQRIAKNGE
jgi:predicted alpha/beta hydrolase family esterase